MCVYTEENTYTLDRIEGPVALLIDHQGGIVEIPADLLPEGCRDGAVLHKLDGLWVRDYAAEAERRESMENKLKKLLEKNK